ncbi:hypothetical protein ACJJTC_019804 [Scirpophaga incertulas]
MYTVHCSILEASTRMIGGDAASYNYGLAHVSLQNLTGHHVCGGAVISRFHAVTAAHCVLGASPEYIKAVVGTTNLDYGGREYEVKNIILHEEYNSTSRTNDIAIIRIKGLFHFLDVEILKVSEEELVEGDEVIITGFGAQSSNGESSRIMHKLHLPVFNQKTCRYAMRYTKEVVDSMFCTFSRVGEGTCRGDSGGPVMKHDRLVGLVSWGIPCAVGFPDVHTRITHYIDWIRKNTYNLHCIRRTKW